METYLGTTPFGRRGVTPAVLASQYKADRIEPGIVRDKWKLFRAVCEARPHLGVTDRALTVLDALLTFYPETELSEKRGLVVFPSNIHLSLRSRGMTPATLRRHLAALVDAGLILRKDSPNGKRYARRDRAGDISQAFGFSLAPLLARAVEIEQLARQVQADREHLRFCRERLTLCRRDITKLLETQFSNIAQQDHDLLHARFVTMTGKITRVTIASDIEHVIEQMEALRSEIINALKTNIKAQEMSGSESHIERHIEDSHPDSNSESEMLGKIMHETASDRSPRVTHFKNRHHQDDIKHIPLSLVLRACPQIACYGPGGDIRSWRDLMSAATVVRNMLGVSDSAYLNASRIIGSENTAAVMACILERAESIKSAGGYIRDLTSRACRGEFSPAPMLNALLRTNMMAS